MASFEEYRVALSTLTYEALAKKIPKEAGQQTLDLLYQHIREIIEHNGLGAWRVGHLGRRELNRLANLALARSRQINTEQTKAVLRREIASYAAQDNEGIHEQERTNSASLSTGRTGRGRSQRLGIDERDEAS